MKNIIVPTDFSMAASHAADYALHIAKYLKANIALCHAFIVPADASNADLVTWPLYDYESLKEESLIRLDMLANKLMEESCSLQNPGTFKPLVTSYAEAKSVTQLVAQLMENKGPALVISGLSGNHAIARLLSGSTSRSLIDQAAYPVLLVPKDYVFKPLHKIAFACSFRNSDMESIQSIASFARYFNAEIVVTHINSEDEVYDNKKAEAFLNEITCKINYDKIFYREINSKSINDGIDWLSTHCWIDLLVMVHRRNSFSDRLLKGSYTKKQLGHLKVPMLVLPEGFCPVF